MASTDELGTGIKVQVADGGELVCFTNIPKATHVGSFIENYLSEHSGVKLEGRQLYHQKYKKEAVLKIRFPFILTMTAMSPFHLYYEKHQQ
jgi:hypothetical protein